MNDTNMLTSGYGGSPHFGFSETGLYTSPDINAHQESDDAQFGLNSGDNFESYNQLGGYTPSKGAPPASGPLNSGANFTLNSGANFTLNSGANFGNLPGLPSGNQEPSVNTHAVTSMLPSTTQLNLTAAPPKPIYPSSSGMSR